MQTSMKSRAVKKEEVEVEIPADSKHHVSGATIESALRSARIPSKYCKPHVALGGFSWGERMRAWVDKVLLQPESKAKSFYVATLEEESMDASAMLTRTLVMRGFDAVWCSLDELVSDEEIIRQSDYLVVAGFYSKEFDTRKGCPLSSAQAHSLSWKLWRASASGVSIIAIVSPSSHDACNWWTNGALMGIFNTTQTLKLKANSI